MAYLYKDKDSNIIHIRIEQSPIALCGLMQGWTNLDDKPVKEKYGSTCSYCQEEIWKLKQIKQNEKADN